MTGFLLKYIVMPVLCLAMGFAAGWKVQDWRTASAALGAEKRVVHVVQAQGSVNQAVAVAQQAAQDRIVTVTRTLIEKVPIYVTAQADRHCIVPNGFVRLHDAAAAGVPPVPFGPGQSADAASGVDLSAVADTVVVNYGACHAAIEQDRGWQAWYAGQRTAFAGKSP